jgi:predicted Zn-ribbon and HTH transcriptional regulator
VTTIPYRVILQEAKVAQKQYICRKCGFEFSAIPGAEEPPDCPECESDEIERLERSTVGCTTGEREENEKES